MPGSLINLSEPGHRLPPYLVLDRNLLVTRFLASYETSLPNSTVKAEQLFRLLVTTQSTGVITSVVWAEVLHHMIRAHYRRALSDARALLRSAYPRSRGHTWQQLYKLRPELMQRLVPELERLRLLLRANGLDFVQPDDLEPVPSGTTVDEELIRIIGQYQVDSSDAAILLEGRRAGVMSIASLDTDMRRAQLDFDVYTWL